MMNWMKRRGPTTYLHREPDVETPPALPGTSLPLYKYLKDRYADTVVLTFEQIESLLGCALPGQARLNQGWWTNAEGTAAEPNYSATWVLARRVATPNLLAKIVVFERA